MILLLFLLFDLNISSKIDTVIIYPNQVIVLRSAEFTITAPDELVIPGLPGGLIDNSIRVIAPGLKTGEVLVRKGYLSEPTPQVKRLEQKVQTLEDSAKMLEDEAAVLKAKEDFLGSIKLGAPEIIAKELQQGKVAPESWRGALSFVADELSQVKTSQLSLKRQADNVKKRLDAAKQELQEARALIENRKELRISVEGEPGTYRIGFSYALPAAAEWQPYYQLRADPAQGNVSVAYFARIWQRTGEDWDKVKVILSTATPSPTITPPEPQPWYLTLIEETFRVKALPAPGAAMAEELAEDRRLFQGMPEVTRLETGISLQYAIPGSISLKSGEGAKKLPLTRVSLPAEFEFYTLPHARENAFLTGTMVNTSQFVLLAGEANTYVGDEFTGSISTTTIAPQESILLGFGVDERVKVKRELLKTYKSRIGLTGKTERVQFTYRTTVENYHSKPIRIKIIEQVPVSRQKEIKVTVTKIEPEYVEYNADSGTYTFQPVLKNGERFQINLEFNVDYPAGKRISGLY
ncbi:MAG: mucoidy inhibitor MuiA family protein [bacterium]